MAVDEALLTSAVGWDQCTVRVYEWSEPTVSLGYFQSELDPELSGRLSGLARVRRPSGGGAILHHHELTYSCAVPASHPIAREPAQLYDLVHGLIIAMLAESGVRATLRGSGPDGPKPFLCFGRGDPRDVVIGPHKIVGSAQRRRTGAVLQHGSLLLRRSQHADEFPGLDDLSGIEVDRHSFAEKLGLQIGRGLGRPVAGCLSDPERELAGRWQYERYECEQLRR